jgi:hypothetical protein
MDLAHKFNLASEGEYLRVRQMIPDREYSITSALRVMSDYGGSVYFFIKDTNDNINKLYNFVITVTVCGSR